MTAVGVASFPAGRRTPPVNENDRVKEAERDRSPLVTLLTTSRSVGGHSGDQATSTGPLSTCAAANGRERRRAPYS